MNDLNPRTALFNWLFARKHGGQFILRIDDTDAQRNVAEALAPILHGFRWLGIDWDEGAEVGGPAGPYYQSQKQKRYQDVAKILLEKGAAYWDFTPEAEAAAERAGCLMVRPLAAAARNVQYVGARGLVTIRHGEAEMPMYLAEADGLDFKLLKTF